MEYLVGGGIAVGIIVLAASLRRALPELVRALTSRVAGRNPADLERAEVHTALAALQTRLGDLEERVDFAERLLAKQRESDRLPAPPA